MRLVVRILLLLTAAGFLFGCGSAESPVAPKVEWAAIVVVPTPTPTPDPFRVEGGGGVDHLPKGPWGGWPRVFLPTPTPSPTPDTGSRWWGH